MGSDFYQTQLKFTSSRPESGSSEKVTLKLSAVKDKRRQAREDTITHTVTQLLPFQHDLRVNP